MRLTTMTLAFSMVASCVLADQEQLIEATADVYPDLMVDLESPPYPIPYVMSQDGGRVIYWDEVTEMMRTGNYQGFSPAFVLEACRVFTRSITNLEATISLDHTPERFRPSAGHVCPTLELVPVG